MIRIDALWLATTPIDMRMGTERLLARVVQVFGSAQAHHGYLFANARGWHSFTSQIGCFLGVTALENTTRFPDAPRTAPNATFESHENQVVPSRVKRFF